MFSYGTLVSPYWRPNTTYVHCIHTLVSVNRVEWAFPNPYYIFVRRLVCHTEILIPENVQKSGTYWRDELIGTYQDFKVMSKNVFSLIPNTISRTLCLTPNFNFSADQHQYERQSTSKTRHISLRTGPNTLGCTTRFQSMKTYLELHWYWCFMLWYCPGQFFRPLKARFSFPFYTYFTGFIAFLAVQRCGSGFWWAASSTHVLVRGIVVSMNFP